MKTMNLNHGFWINPPTSFVLSETQLEFETSPNTDMWQKTYYGFEPNNAPMFLFNLEDDYFSFEATVTFESRVLYDQAGVIIYHTKDHWMKASIEFEDTDIQRLGSVVTTYGYSDWATTDIGTEVSHATYRVSRRKMDFKIEVSFDGILYSQLRIYHDPLATGHIQIGLYACSPQESCFKASFSNIQVLECLWQ